MDLETSSSSHLPPTPPSEPVSHNDRASVGPMAAGIGTATTSTTTYKHIWVITGPAGSGKTSVAQHLHETFQFPYLEGDTFHTPANVQKMADGHPLNDEDRWDWLILLRQTALSALSSANTNVIVTCSALKRKYRDVLRIACYHNPSIVVHFIFLYADEQVLMERVRGRKDHYMKDYMVRSQFESLEAPERDEDDVLPVAAGGGEMEVAAMAARVVGALLEMETEVTAPGT